MGLLDGLVGDVLGSVLGGGSQSRNPFGARAGQAGGGNMLLQLALMLLQQQGGLERVLGKFRQSGMSQQADSWVSTGQNMNISPDQLQQTFGSSTIRDLAAQLGIPQEEAGSAIAHMLPEVINRLTPDGQIPQNSNDEISHGLNALANSEMLK